jgi:signal peptidase I
MAPLPFRVDKARVKSELREWVEAILIALVMALVIRAFVVQAFKIPSGSMYPTLKIGDRLFVNKFIYRFRDPQRWDIIVFKYPEDPSKDFIKRLVGLSGETVEIRNGAVFVNGVKQSPPKEIANNVYYNTDEGDYGAINQKVVVPPDHYFVLGDNSGNSRDSRMWGFVSRKKLVGKAFVRWWPLHRVGTLDREFPKDREST